MTSKLMKNWLRSSSFAVAMLAASAVWSGPEEGLFQAAKIMFSSAEGQSPELKISSYKSIKKVLDQITVDYPASDIAVRIMLKDTIDGVDVATIEAALAQQDEAEAPVEKDIAPGAVAESPIGGESEVAGDDVTTPDEIILDPLANSESIGDEQLSAFPPLEFQIVIRTEKEIVVDVQNELNRLGCNAGGADGAAGRKTKSAFSSFIKESGSDLTDRDLATEEAVLALKEMDGRVCKVRTMASTPASQLGGSWGFRSECPGLGNRIIKNTGSMRLKYTGSDTLRGTARNQQGIQGPAVIQFQGRTAATIIRFGFVTLKGNLARSSKSMTISGTGARRCKVVAWKN